MAVTLPRWQKLINAEHFPGAKTQQHMHQRERRVLTLLDLAPCSLAPSPQQMAMFRSKVSLHFSPSCSLQVLCLPFCPEIEDFIYLPTHDNFC